MSVISKINPKLIKFLEEHDTHNVCAVFDKKWLRINFICIDCEKSASCKYKEILKREYQPHTQIQVTDGNISFLTDFATYNECARFLVDKYNIQVN